MIAGTWLHDGDPLNRLLLDEQKDEAVKHIKRLREIFDERFVIELQVNEASEQKFCNEALYKIAKKLGIPFVITNDYHYIGPESVEPHRMWKYIDYIKGRSIKDVEYCSFQGYPTTGHFVASHAELQHLWETNQNGNPEIFKKACEKTMELAESCNAVIDKSHKMVKFPVPDGMSKMGYMKELIKKGWQRRRPEFAKGTGDYKKRLTHEINIIREMGFVDYFFMVEDFVSAAKDRGIPIGPGRGSAAGSLLSWLLGITAVDPLRYGLQFERFLNPNRKKMPDIDIDVCKRGRGEMIQYMKDRWGEENVAAIATYSRFSPNSLFRDVTRALDFDYGIINPIAKTIDESLSWDENLEVNDKLADIAEAHPELQNYMDELDGNIRNVGVHAAGFILTNNDASRLMPLRRVMDSSKNVSIISEIEGSWLEKFGFIKNDILGLKTLTILNDAALAAGMTWQELEDIPKDDHDVFDLYNQGDTVGVFQFHGSGMTDLAREVVVTDIEDLAACNSMYRPAVLKAGVDKKFVDRRNGKEDVEYIDDSLIDILSPTEGLIIYQEQIIEILSRIGLDYGDADTMRRDMELVYKGALDHSALDDWIEVAKKTGFGGYSEKAAKKIVDQILAQVGYLFNKSHSVGYSILGYMCQWLKVYHPYEFFTSCLNNEDKLEKIDEYIVYLLSSYDLKVEIGNLNKFNVDFQIEDDILRIGLANAKGLSGETLDMISSTRPYESVLHFFESPIGWRKVNKKKIEILIELQAFDGMPFYHGGPKVMNRNHMQKFYDGIRTYRGRKPTNDYLIKPREDKTEIWQEVIDGIVDVTCPDPSFAQMAETEIKYFGFHILYNPLNYILSRYSHKKMKMVAPGDTTPIPGVVTKIKLHNDRNGKPMAFLGLKTHTGIVDVVVFAFKWQHLVDRITHGAPGIFFVKKSDRGSAVLEGFRKVEPPADYLG